MANIAIFGTLQNVTDGAIAEGTQIVGGRMSVATIEERDAIPAGVLKDGTEVYVTETELTYRWNAANSAFEKVTYSQLPEPTEEDNGKLVSVVNAAYALTEPEKELPPITEADDGKYLGVVEDRYQLVTPNLYGGSGRRLIWSSEEGTNVTDELGLNPIGKTIEIEYSFQNPYSGRRIARFVCESSTNVNESASVYLIDPYNSRSGSGAQNIYISGYLTARARFQKLSGATDLQYMLQVLDPKDCETRTTYTTNVDGDTTMTATETTVTTFNTTSCKVFKLYLIEGTNAIEEHTIPTSAWSALTGSNPYTYSTTITVTAKITDTSIIELYNNNAVLFATYGFAIGAVNGQTVTVYSIGKPTESVTLTIQIGG